MSINMHLALNYTYLLLVTYCSYTITFRNELSSIKKLSSTDIQCYWSTKQKNVALEQYQAKPINQWQCLNVKSSIPLATVADRNKCFARLLLAAPDSALAKAL